ncbi:ATP-binding protein [Rhodoferax sp.]|uniref:sensor histidine kinase n=1 Tax=Rhodoferax sp. TaxID=50421 RepID=UPI001EC152DA|nr:ATP-binding protein [Rhodoferax sp.]MBT9505896.1 two-component sensor histidine kinase [Rhodoferax sp.]
MTDTPQALQQENERLQRELGQARAELEDFTYSVSHDLRASLRHVNAYVKIIKEDLGDQPPALLISHLDTVSHAARQMGQQIDGLMELSRLARVDVQLSALDMAALIRDVRASLPPALDGHVFEWQVAPDFPPLQGDGLLIRQVLVHLLSNALKFSGTRALARIEISWQAHDGGLCALTVKDNGVGFNPQYVDKLFHAFQRLHSSREFEGIGMGLALTRKIVERHGGAVWASGAPDAGCSVSFTLPLAGAPAPQTCCASR